MSEERKRAAIELVRRAHREADALFRSLDATQLERPVFTGEGPGWRIRDLIAHYACWQTIAARAGEKMATATAPGPEERFRHYIGLSEEIDELNDGNFRSWREGGVDQALAELRVANDRLVAAMEALPAEKVLTGDGPEDFHRYFWQPGVNHPRQHREHIDTALKEATKS